MERMTFKVLKKYISRIDRLSICDKDTLIYNNFNCIADVPDIYDDMYVYGIGMVDSEFPKTEENDKMFILPCIEIMVSASL